MMDNARALLNHSSNVAPRDLKKDLKMKIAILSLSDVVGWYAATLMKRGHNITIGTFGYPPAAVASLIEDGIDGVLLLSDDPEDEDIAAQFAKATGRPVWRNLTDIPR
jgi:hypothetical protein